MTDQKHLDYQRIEKAIHYIKDHFKAQPSLEDIAEAVHVSPFHFQRMFRKWVGVSPKKFMQYISLDYAKGLLERRLSLLDTAYETGLSGPSRLHDLFVNIEAMTPGEFKNGGANLTINFGFADSPFGKIIVASTQKGLCTIHFEEEKQKALSFLQSRFPNATYQQTTDQFQKDALAIFQADWHQLDQIKLHLAGTPFQLKVWESLLKIPRGALSTYGQVAKEMGHPKSSRAVANAIGKNPVAVLIPCHRVIQSSGKLGGYMWGENKKTAIIGWEAAKTAQSNV